MDGFSIAVAVLIGLLLRLGVPILVMIGFIYILRRMDAHWQEEAQHKMETAHVSFSQAPCWEVRGCTPETRQRCAGFMHSEIPCWQQFRSSNGLLKEGCLDCLVFLNASEPVTAR
jgi:hypothetical protein